MSKDGIPQLQDVPAILAFLDKFHPKVPKE